MISSSLLQRIADIRSDAPATRRAILDLILEDPDRVLEESFEQLAERSRSSVPTIMIDARCGTAVSAMRSGLLTAPPYESTCSSDWLRSTPAMVRVRCV